MTKRFTYDDVKFAFENRGYILLSETYKNYREKLKFICPYGHEYEISFIHFNRGQECGICNRNWKLDFDSIRAAFEARDFKLVSTEYHNNNSKLEYICPIGHTGFISWATFQKGVGCGECYRTRGPSDDFIKEQFEIRNYTFLRSRRVKDRIHIDYICDAGHQTTVEWGNFYRKNHGCRYCAGNVKPTIDFVRESFASSGYLLISDQYINSHSKLSFLCPNGHEGTIRWGEFNMGVRCRQCNVDSQRLDIEFVRSQFERRGFTLLTGEYVNAKQELDYICPNGHRGITSWDRYSQKVHVCLKCFRNRMRGSLHPMWNHNKTDEERLKGRSVIEVRIWRKAIFDRDKYTCRRCGVKGVSLNAHHLNSWSAYPEQRFDIDNGITLCEKCHIKFHKKYGNRRNTREQYEHWITDAQPTG